ncbi:MAG TPA: nitroreductase/quinone reductase family protein [Nocardioides sp.]|nr:nitroreductase/quinone reductase family protein [Nocardioides sp.]
MTLDKFHVVRFTQRRLMNPMVRGVLVRGWRIPGYALLETTGRTSGLPRRTPVGDGLDGDTFWIVAEHGRRADYVRNIETNPRVRVLVRGRWRAGTAVPMPDDDTRERQRILGRHGMGRRLNDVAVRSLGTDLLSVRIDLEPQP